MMARPSALDDDIPPQAVGTIDAGPESQAALDDLIAKATAEYAVKHYNTAAEHYSRATEMQANLNGEMNIRNADLLYLYGRCLYHVAIQNSDILGNKVAGDDNRRNTEMPSIHAESPSITTDRPTLPDDLDTEAAPLHGSISGSASEKATDTEKVEISKPYFTITGDENWDESEDELVGDGNNEGDEVDEAEDDFSNAFEVLDIARVLLEKRLLELSGSSELRGQEKDHEATEKDRLESRRLRGKLADTRDLQAEIGLEAERFHDAAVDLEVSLDIKKDLYPFESSVIAEAHYKLSLALEFSSTVSATDGAQPLPSAKTRSEAAWHMERAIQSCQERINFEEAILQEHSTETGQNNTSRALQKEHSMISRRSIDEVKDMIYDMQQRLKELKEPPSLIQNATVLEPVAFPNSLLESIANTSPEFQKAKLQEALEKANDLSSLVKKKRKEEGYGEKRKAEEPFVQDPAHDKKLKNS